MATLLEAFSSRGMWLQGYIRNNRLPSTYSQALGEISGQVTSQGDVRGARQISAKAPETPRIGKHIKITSSTRIIPISEQSNGEREKT